MYAQRGDYSPYIQMIGQARKWPHFLTCLQPLPRFSWASTLQTLVCRVDALAMVTATLTAALPLP